MEFRTAKLGELQGVMLKSLKDLYPERELKGILNMLFTHVTGLSHAQLILKKDKVLSESDIFFLQKSLKRLHSYEPVQYITGIAHFYGLDLVVDENVLIPRPETEELVDWISRNEGRNSRKSILDIGTGSGCIAISLKKNLPGTSMHALDISEGALSIARKNAASHDVDIKFIPGSILEQSCRDSLATFDLIVSNPPYVTLQDKENMLPNVTNFEPSLALFIEDDPLLFYREIIGFCEHHLKEGGALYFESNEAYADQVAGLLENAGFKEVEVRKDMQGKERMVMGVRC